MQFKKKQVLFVKQFNDTVFIIWRHDPAVHGKSFAQKWVSQIVASSTG